MFRERESTYEAAAETMRPEQAREIMGPEHFFGPDEIRAKFRGLENIPPLDQFAPIPCSAEQLEKAKALGARLILQWNTCEGQPFTIEAMRQRITPWCNANPMKSWGGRMNMEAVPAEPSWVLVLPAAVASTLGECPIDQMKATGQYLLNHGFLEPEEIAQMEKFNPNMETTRQWLGKKREGVESSSLADEQRSEFQASVASGRKVLMESPSNVQHRSNAWEVVYQHYVLGPKVMSISGHPGQTAILKGAHGEVAELTNTPGMTEKGVPGLVSLHHLSDSRNPAFEVVPLDAKPTGTYSLATRPVLRRMPARLQENIAAAPANLSAPWEDVEGEEASQAA